MPQTYRSKLTDEGRKLWVLNDEGLHNLYLSTGLSMDDFIDIYRGDIDDVVNSVVTYRGRR